MDLDAYVREHQGEWQRLSDLAGKRKLTGAQADELLDLYQRTGTHLSQIRSSAPDPVTVRYLSTIVAKARTRASGTRTSSGDQLSRFFLVSFPVALYRSRRWWMSVLVLCLLVSAVIGWWTARTPGVASAIATPEQIAKIVESDFENYYSEHAAQEFALRVWTNNAWIAAICVGAGVLGLPVVLVLWQNTVNLGVMGGIMAGHDRAGLFFGLILPHGLLELTAVFVAAGAGLQVFWSWVEPGRQPRLQSLAAAARSAMVLALGLVVVLLISGIIEAFVTPSPLPTWARIGIGVAAEVAFLAYVFGPGRRAALAGASADLDEADRGATDLVI